MRIKKQQDIRDCGINVIQALCAFFHKQWISINELKAVTNYGQNGINAHNLVALGKKYGIKLTPYHVKLNDLKQSNINDYMIALIKNHHNAHYVIIKLHRKFILIFDSINGKEKISYEKFRERFMALIFLVEKIDLDYQRVNLYNPWQIIMKKSPLIFIICLLTIISLLLMFLSSFFLKIILDQIIPGHLTNTLLVVTISFSFIAILRVSFNFIQDYLCKKIALYFEYELYKVYFQKFTLAKLQELNKLTTSEHLQRVNLIPQISEFITSCYRLIFEHSLLLVVSIVILLWLSLQMFAVALLFGFFIVIFTGGLQIKLRFMYDGVIQAQIESFKAQNDLVMSLYELKNRDFETFLRQIIDQKNLINKKRQYEVWKMLTTQNIICELIALISPIVLTFVATNLIFDNKISLGTMLFFLSILHHFFNTLKNLTTFVTSFSYNYKNLNLLKFCLSLKNEQLITGEQKNIELKLTKIETIQAKDLIFSYDKPFFVIKDWLINQSIHLIGPNGTGKTTLLKLINGLYVANKPLLINDYPLTNYSLTIYRQKIFFANPNSYLPNWTIFEYITLNNSVAAQIFINNCKQYNLFTLFNKVGINLHTLITDNGQNLSSGQKQVIIFLRLLAFKYDIILNDEGLENIDDETILILKNAINKFQSAIFIEISHTKKYLSTGKDLIINEIITHFA